MAKYSIDTQKLSNEYLYNIVASVIHNGNNWVEITYFEDLQQIEHGVEIYFLNSKNLSDGHYYSRVYDNLNNIPTKYKGIVNKLIGTHKEIFLKTID